MTNSSLIYVFHAPDRRVANNLHDNVCGAQKSASPPNFFVREFTFQASGINYSAVVFVYLIIKINKFNFY